MLLDVLVQEEPLASPVSPVSPGEIVAGKYCVERLLGTGGMGVVVSARHTTLDQVVAIKFLVANRFDSREEAIRRFLDEARAAARIESDFVCRVFDVGTLDSGVPFMVMEHLDGCDLDEELAQRGQLAIDEAVDIVLQAADALAAAHQLGIVHRDIKPANIFLSVRPDGTRRVKVLDFGISRMHGAPYRALDLSASLGTPAYMSPEQVRGDVVDARADIWALGAIFYELVTGQMAFAGDDVKAILDHVVQDDPCPMTSLRRNVPAPLEAVVMRALARDPHARWPSAAQLARALGPFGSAAVFSQLASVQRELGSLSSLSSISVRRTAPHSMEPMVASVRPSVPTMPDPAELLAREGIAQDWSRSRQRKRTTRAAIVALAAVAFLGAAAVVTVRLEASRHPSNAASAGAAAPPPALDAVPGPAEVASAAPSSGSMYPASSSVHSARSAAPRGSASARPAARPAAEGTVNHLLDPRD